MKSKLLSTIILTVLFTAYIDASSEFSDSHRIAAEELMDSMQIGEMLDKTIDQMLELQLQQNPGMIPFEKVFKEFFSKYMSEDALKEDFMQMYMEIFSESELLEISKFYQTDIGKKVLAYQPEMTAKGAAIGMKKVQENMAELQTMIQKESERIQSLQETD